MSTCAELRADLALLAQGVLDGPERDAVEAHVDACPTCADELAVLRSVVALVRKGTEIEPTAAETDRLLDAVDAELEAQRAKVHVHPAWRRTWDSAVWRYENSTRFRRITLTSIGLHAAAAAVIAWFLVGGVDGARRPTFGVEWNREMAELEEDTQRALEDSTGASHRVDPDEFVAGDPPPYEAATPEGVRLPSVMEPGSLRSRGERLRAPTFGILVRLRAVVDEDDRVQRLSERVGETLAPRAEQAVVSGLAWLAGQQSDDGRWGPTPDDGQEDVRDGVTGAAVLAFVQNGHSAREGEHAEVLGPAVTALERRLRDGPAARDLKPVYSHALALRALTWEWALDFRHLSPDERAARQRLLANAGRELVRWQHASGGFGYRPGDRPDASCTLFVTGALSDLRLAGVLRADETLERAGTYLKTVRGGELLQGYREPGDRAGDPALTAGVLAYARDLGLRGDLGPQMRAVREALTEPHSPDVLLAWSGLQALRRHGDVAPALERFLDRQSDDGRWPSATDRHCRLGGDDLTTAMGVLAVSRVYLP